MTDGTAVRTDATTETHPDDATTGTDATTETRTDDTTTDNRTDDATAAAPRPAKARNGKGRTKRPTKAAPRTDAAPPVPTDADDATDVADPASTAAPAAKKRAPRTAAPKQPQTLQPVVLAASGLVKRYGQTLAVDEVDLEIRQGSIFGVVGPNGAGKTTTLSMITGLLRPDAGSVTVLDHDVWADPTAAKRSLGVLPDRLRLFDRLTGAQLLYYSATLRGLDGATARKRSADLAEAFGLGEALGRQVADYSVGMAKKIALAATLIHSPRVLVLDEPFESVDPVSAATITDILRRYTRGGGTVVLSSHSMELVQRTCDSVAIIVGGKVLASGTMAQVRGRKSLEDKFVELAGGRVVAESMEWLHSFSG
ncbi:ABC transporter ATP-binding protein [Curtobacterium sp. MCLR17_059]|nr:ABC transporter ATP-binding protein [Curtobacterium sp. MCLR17_059]PZF53788.1 ABC transporter ATP-binding protein [Curtobacterium sp. MCLR17_057]